MSSPLFSFFWKFFRTWDFLTLPYRAEHIRIYLATSSVSPPFLTLYLYYNKWLKVCQALFFIFFRKFSRLCLDPTASNVPDMELNLWLFRWLPLPTPHRLKGFPSRHDYNNTGLKKTQAFFKKIMHKMREPSVGTYCANRRAGRAFGQPSDGTLHNQIAQKISILVQCAKHRAPRMCPQSSARGSNLKLFHFHFWNVQSPK